MLPGFSVYFLEWQVSPDGHPPQPQVQPDFFRLRRLSSAPVTAAATMATTKMLPQFSRKNSNITDHTLPGTRPRMAAAASRFVHIVYCC